jgi:glycosyltransferase involved in cell wall biosynthesis
MYSEKPTGVGICTREIWKHLHKTLDNEGIEYVIYAYDRAGLNYSEKTYPVQLPFILQFLSKKFLSLHRLIWNIFYLPLIAKNYDLVYSFSSHGSPFIKNQIVTIHDLICFSFPKQHRFQFLYFKYIFPCIVKAAKKIVVVSEFTKREVIKHYNVAPAKVVVILNGGDHLNRSNDFSLPNDEKQKAEELSSKKFFLTVGATYPHKNVERLVEAMQQFRKNILLVIVGMSNTYYNSLSRRVNQQKLDNVVFLSYVSPDFLSWLYKNCVANVYISLYEGFGFPPFEAALQNKFSVISKCGALPEIYKGAAYYVDAYNIEEIKQVLEHIASPDFSSAHYEEKFSELIDKYQWSKAAVEVYELIIKCSHEEMKAA